MGKVIILPETTKDPISLIGRRAGVCWGADITDASKNYKRGLDCIKCNHGRTLEYVNIEMILDGYSAKVIREYYTHLSGSPTRLQASTRYIDYSKGEGFNYITPHTVEKNNLAKTEWDNLMKTINCTIYKFINEYNIPVEDATNMLPLAYSTKIVDKRNLRSFIDMSRQRECSRAYWEYREMFNDIKKALADISDEWKYLIDTQFMPKCEYLGYCPERYSCGRKSKKED